MRRQRSTFAEVALAASVALLVLGERSAHAQACCVAPSTTGVGRLAMVENALMGLEARGAAGYGSFEAGGQYRRAPGGTHDVALEQNLFATGRFLSRGQGTLTVPFVETLRGASGSSSAGGGLGDVRIGVRWDAIHADEAHPWPGLALLAGVALPTGTPPERAKDALGTDATGTGTTQGWAGLALEEAFGPWLLTASSLVTLRAAREVQGLDSSLPPRFTAALAGGHVWTSGVVVSTGASYAIEGDASVGGKEVPGTGRRALQLTLAMQIPTGRGTRFLVAAFAVPPLESVNAGEAATTGLSLALVVPWL